jgi:hypothetical protein
MKNPIKIAAAFCVAWHALVVCGLAQNQDADDASLAQWKAHVESLKKDPSLVRYYLFEEKKGLALADSAAEGKGNMTILSCSPYGPSRERGWRHTTGQRFIAFPEWTTGRFSGKGALTSGHSTGVVRSRFSGTDSGVFTVEGWVRLHGDRGDEAVSALFNVGDGWKNGWKIVYQRTKSVPNGRLEMRFGGAEGAVIVSGTTPVDPQVWHHVAGQWDGKMLKVYLDGALCGKKECAGPYVDFERNEQWSRDFPEYETKGFNFGGGGSGSERFDVDEVAIFSRALSANEIRRHYEEGCPVVDAPTQKIAFQKELENLKKLKAIKMDIPKETYGIFRQNDKIPAKVTIPAANGWSGDYEAHYLVRDIQNGTVFSESRKLTASPAKDAVAEVDFSTSKCGVYFFDMWLTDTQGKTVKRLPEEYGIAITVPLPAAKDVPLSSPLMAHNIAGNDYENQFLGFGVDRRIKGNDRSYNWETGEFNEKVFQPEFEFTRKAGLKVMYCIHIALPPKAERVPGKKWLLKDMKPWADYVRTLYRHYKDDVAFWEIENEPNASNLIAADEYVEFLKVGYQTIKEENPNAIVLGLAGCPGFLNWNEAVYKAGGAKYFDVLTLHNYNGRPIKATAQDHLIERAIDQLVKYRGTRVPVWNGETGMHTVARIDNRPITDDVFIRTYGANRVRTAIDGGPLILGTDMPTLTERYAAAYQVQTALLDLGSGCEKFVLLNGASHYAPTNNTSDGQPSETAPAIAALASVLIPSQSVEKLPLSSSSDAAAIITQKGGRRIAAVFSDEKPTLSFHVDRSGTFRGMDMFGNPLQWEANTSKVLTLQLGMEPIYIFDVPQDFAQIQFLKIGKAPATLPDNGVMDGELVVTNPLDTPLVLTLQPEAPKGATLQAEGTVQLKPKESKTVPFRLEGRELKRRQYEIGFQLLNGAAQLSKLSYTFQSNGSIRNVAELIGKPALGDNLWWKGLAPEVCSDVESVVFGQPVTGAPWVPQWKNAEDLSFELRSAWKEDGSIFIRIDVTDNVVMPAPTAKRNVAFKYDCIELFFDGRSLADRKDVMTEGAQQIMVIPNAGEKAAPLDWWLASKKATVQANFVGGRSEHGYWVEGTIQPEPGTAMRVRTGTQYALDVMIDDMDTETEPRKAAMALHGTFNNAVDPSKWGRYQLETQPKK